MNGAALNVVGLAGVSMTRPRRKSPGGAVPRVMGREGWRMQRRTESPWSTDRVRKTRERTNALRDAPNWSGRGRYLSPPKGPGPGRGPYPWKAWGKEAFAQPEHGWREDLSGTETEGWYRFPDTSHLESGRLIHSLDPDGPLVLEILFRKGKKRLYRYYGENGRQARLETIWGYLQEMQHPGAGIWAYLTLEQFPYS